MAIFANEGKPKLTFKHCKSLPKLIKAACAHHCHMISCLRTPSSSSSSSSLSGGESFFYDDDGDYLDSHYEIIMEIMRARAMIRAKSKSFAWPMPPARSQVVFFTSADHDRQENGEQEDESSGGVPASGEDVAGMVDDESEAFFSVKSCFSSCLQLNDDDDFNVDGAKEYYELLKKRSIFEEFRHCEGWPFGLCRRVVALPPLPSSPADSWMWNKRVVCKGF